MNITNEITAYLSYCESQKKLNKKSLKAYSIDLRQFARHLEAETIEGQNSTEQVAAETAITKAAICSYIAELHKSFAPKTAKRKLASIRAFLNYLEFEEIVEVNPLRKILTRFQEPKVLPKVIPLDAVYTRYLNHCKIQHATTAPLNAEVVFA